MNILIVEDSVIEATLLQKTLEKVLPGSLKVSHVQTLATAQDFLKVSRAETDLVFLDLGLPDSRDWHETYKAILPHAEHLPIIVMTANKSPEVVQELMKHGIQDYIVKGSRKHDAELLKETIEFALMRHKVVGDLSKKIEEKDQCVHWLTGGYSAG